jgi:hypothetical protein
MWPVSNTSTQRPPVSTQLVAECKGHRILDHPVELATRQPVGGGAPTPVDDARLLQDRVDTERERHAEIDAAWHAEIDAASVAGDLTVGQLVRVVGAAGTAVSEGVTQRRMARATGIGAAHLSAFLNNQKTPDQQRPLKPCLVEMVCCSLRLSLHGRCSLFLIHKHNHTSPASASPVCDDTHRTPHTAHIARRTSRPARRSNRTPDVRRYRRRQRWPIGVGRYSSSL